MPLSPSGKIALGWTLIIATGLSGFIFARDSVIKNRRVLMDTRQRIRDQAQREGEHQFELSKSNREKSDLANQ